MSELRQRLLTVMFLIGVLVQGTSPSVTAHEGARPIAGAAP